MLQHPKNRLNSSACGRYQIVRTTARAIRDKLPSRYPGNRIFDEACQDEMACYLLGVRGVDKYLAGRLSEDTLIANLAQEW
jgi:muramidase (phage lysozyme)